MFGLGEGESNEIGWGLKRQEGEGADVSLLQMFFKKGEAADDGRVSICRGRRSCFLTFELSPPSETKSGSLLSPKPILRKLSLSRITFETTSSSSWELLSTINLVRSSPSSSSSDPSDYFFPPQMVTPSSNSSQPPPSSKLETPKSPPPLSRLPNPPL